MFERFRSSEVQVWMFEGFDRLKGLRGGEYSFQWDSIIFSASGTTETYWYKLLYLGQDNLIYEGVYIDPGTLEKIDVEYRFKPED